MTRLDVWGNPIDLLVPNTVVCKTCSAAAERCSTADQGHGVIFHNYRCENCRDAGRIDGGTIVEREGSISRRIGPVFQRSLNQIDVGEAVAESPSDTGGNTGTEADTITEANTITNTKADSDSDTNTNNYEPHTPVHLS